MNFVAIDVETANSDMGSICQIEIVKYADGRLVEEWVSLIDPEDYFDYINISIHGIDEDVVKGSTTFPQITEILAAFLNNAICVRQKIRIIKESDFKLLLQNA